jgi:hypothetical protein
LTPATVVITCARQNIGAARTMNVCERAPNELRLRCECHAVKGPFNGSQVTRARACPKHRHCDFQEYLAVLDRCSAHLGLLLVPSAEICDSSGPSTLAHAVAAGLKTQSGAGSAQALHVTFAQKRTKNRHGGGKFSIETYRRGSLVGKVFRHLRTAARISLNSGVVRKLASSGSESIAG